MVTAEDLALKTTEEYEAALVEVDALMRLGEIPQDQRVRYHQLVDDILEYESFHYPEFKPLGKG